LSKIDPKREKGISTFHRGKSVFFSTRKKEEEYLSPQHHGRGRSSFCCIEGTLQSVSFRFFHLTRAGKEGREQKKLDGGGGKGGVLSYLRRKVVIPENLIDIR